MAINTASTSSIRPGFPSGTVYPALSRLERDGFVKSAWEDEHEAHSEGRPARRYYKLTAPGVKALADAATTTARCCRRRSRDGSGARSLCSLP